MITLRDAAQQALEFCEFLWREVAMNDYAEERREATEAALRAALAEPEPDNSHSPPYSDDVKQIAYQLDPECWISYSGKPKRFKQEMERRRKAALNRALEKAHNIGGDK